MKRKNTFIAVLIALLCIISILFVCLTGCKKTPEDSVLETVKDSNQILSIENLDGKKVGVLTGSVNETYILKYLPECETVYFNSNVDMAVALNTGKIDAYVNDETTEKFITRNYPEHSILVNLGEIFYGMFFPKNENGEKLCDQINDYISTIRSNGTMNSIYELWFGDDDSIKNLDMSGLTGENGTVRMAISTDVGYPFTYLKDGTYIGYDVDIVLRFCREYGYELELINYDFSGILSAVSAGKADIGGCGVTVTEERSESVLFSDPTLYSNVVVVVYNEDKIEGSDDSQQTVLNEHDEKTARLSSEFYGKRIGVITGGVFADIAGEYIQECSVEYFNSSADEAYALDVDRIDGYIVEYPTYKMLSSEYSDQYIYEFLQEEEYGFIFKKDDEKGSLLRQKMDLFLDKLSESGEMSEIVDIWFGNDDSKKTIDFSGFTGENGELTMAISTDVGAPYAYVNYNQYIGFDVDIAVRFCREYGYALTISDFSFGGLLASVTAGRCDFGASSVVITEERAESMDFSVPYYYEKIVLVAKKNSISDELKENTTDKCEELRGSKIAVLTGTILDQVAYQMIPDCQLELLNTNADLALSLESGIVDAYITDEPIGRMLTSQYTGHCITDIISKDNYAYIFQKDNEKSDLICAQMNAFLQKLRKENLLEEIDGIWFGDDESKKVIDFSNLENINGELTLAVSSSVGAPFCYIKDESYVGYDVDIAVRFCKEYGYSLKIFDCEFGAVFTAVCSGKCDFGASCITVTEERKENMNFSEPNYEGGVVIVQKAEDFLSGQLLAQIYGKRVGVLTGTVSDTVAEECIPKNQIEYFNNNADIALALEEDKIDTYIVDSIVAVRLTSQYPDQSIYTSLKEDDFGFIFTKNNSKSEMLLNQFNEFIALCIKDGTAEDIEKIWLGTDTDTQKVNYSDLTGENGTINFATSTTIGEPVSYIKDGAYAGLDIDWIVRFCRAYGYALNIVDNDFSGLLSAVATGKCDMGGSSISITEERKQSINFSDPYFHNRIVMVVKNDDANAKSDNLWESIKESFQKNFIRENRWKLFVNGIKVTLLITICSALCGTIIGFIIYLAYRKKILLVNVIIDLLSDILQKTPVVVILMIFYYLVFGKSTLDGIWVSCIAFSLIFACSVAGVLKVSVDAIDRGQTEAAQALGYSDTHAFVRVILPQALQHFFPIYRSEIVTLIKSSAIVGYIAVQDLTKVSDIIRSRTYEAFFPLIVSAVIYFAIAWLLSLLVRCIQINTNSKHRSKKRVLKGVNTK